MEADSSVGKIYVDAKGMTLYTFDKDEPGKTNCYDKCAANWPPFIAADGAVAEGEWTIVERTDGSKMWAYDGKPLYLYIKDEKALNEFLIGRAVDALTLRGANGQELHGESFAALVEELLLYRDRMVYLDRRNDRRIVAEAIRTGLADSDLSSESTLRSKMETIIEALRAEYKNTVWEMPEIGADPDIEGIFYAEWKSRVSGTSITTRFDRAFVNAPEWQTVMGIWTRFDEYGGSVEIDDGKSEEPQTFTSPDAALNYILEFGKKGQTIQRYKGLGEMNPDQLWETTMDPDVRRLLRVQIEDAVEADDIFTVGNARPLDQALQHATTEMLAWLESDYGYDLTAATHLMGQTVGYDVGKPGFFCTWQLAADDSNCKVGINAIPGPEPTTGSIRRVIPRAPCAGAGFAPVRIPGRRAGRG